MALKTNQTWSKAAEAYTELIELKKARGLGVEPALILDCAESAQKGHRRDLLEQYNPSFKRPVRAPRQTLALPVVKGQNGHGKMALCRLRKFLVAALQDDIEVGGDGQGSRGWPDGR